MKYRSLMMVAAALLVSGCTTATSPLSKDISNPLGEFPQEMPILDQLTPLTKNASTPEKRVNTPLEITLAAAKVSRNALVQAMKRVSSSQKAELEASLAKLDLEIKTMEAKLKAK